MLEQTKIDELKAKHGKLHQLISPEGESVVVRMPTRAEWKRFLSKGTEGSDRPAAIENLLRDCLLDPTEGEFTSMLDKRPGLAVTFGNELTLLAGAGVKVEKKEL